MPTASRYRVIRWPLPWPGRGDRAGWVSILASWLLMLLLAALAILIAILIFQQSPQQSPPPPVPPTSVPEPPAGGAISLAPQGGPAAVPNLVLRTMNHDESLLGYDLPFQPPLPHRPL